MNGLQTVVMQIATLLTGQTPADEADRESARMHVREWLEAAPAEKWHCKPADFAGRLSELITRPHLLYQGSYGWCGPAAYLNLMLRRSPFTVARYATALYDTGKASLRALSVDVSGGFPAYNNLMSFDLPKYAREWAEDHNGSELAYKHADWIMLAALRDYGNDLVDFEGPKDDYGASAPVTDSEYVTFLEDTGIYSSVDVVRFSAGDSANSIVTAIGAAPDADVILVGQMSYFSQGQVLFGRHAASLVSPIEVEGSELHFSYWSWGVNLNNADLSDVTGGFTMRTSASDFISNIGGAIVGHGAS